MAIFSIPNVKLCGISACVPSNEVSNHDYEFISDKERESLVKNIGVEKRRVRKDATLTTSDMCFASAKKLMETLKWDKQEIGLLIFVSQSNDYIIPNTSGILQHRLGLPKTCMAMDVGMGCSGYVYGLATIAGLIHSGMIKKALLLVGDISTSNVSYRDKSAYPLFGDAGTATALEYQPGAEEIRFNMQSDGAGYDAIIIPSGGMRNPVSEKSFELRSYSEGIERSDLHVAMNGIDVFNFALREVAPNIKALAERYTLSIEEANFVVFHQANKLINNTIRKILKISPDKTPTSLAKFGNTSSASIPLTMVSEISEPLRTGKCKLILSAFGVGLSWGTVFITTENLVIPELIEI
ncbi:MAG: ketoacyl-ACP synthase III [Bacteroidales bacterium]|jgi:3-oxoacyl-[acyl-carrier-protein] synthase-3|nr:ketoacyl-ACP synthase III [Bacteroidales bacterium]HPE86249.1 ketoacyl-ACP synthase III [Bacteroidales bacterium]